MKSLKVGLEEINPVNLIAGIFMILAGMAILVGKINLGIMLVLIGLLMVYIKKILRNGRISKWREK